jgi:hypothetical protein
VLAPPGQVQARQFTGLGQQQLQRAPQRAFGAEVGAAKLLRELTHGGRQDLGFLPAGRAKARRRARAAVEQRLAAIQAGSGPGCG